MRPGCVFAAVALLAGCGGGDDPRLAFELVIARETKIVEPPTAILRLATAGTHAGARDGDPIDARSIVRVLDGRIFECVAPDDTAQQRELGLSTCRHAHVDGDDLVVPFAGVPRPWFISFDGGTVMIDDAERAGSDATARAHVGPLDLACTGQPPSAAATICASLRAR